MNLLLKASAAAAAAAVFGCPVLAAEYDAASNTVSPSDTSASYQTMAVIDSADNVYFMDTASAGLPAGMTAALMSGGLEDGEYILRLKLTDGGVINENFSVGAETPAGTEMTYAGAESTGEVEINGEMVETESRGYYADGAAGGMKITVSFTYKGQSYSYTYGGELPNIESKIAVQIDNVPVSINDMKVMLTN